MAAQDSLEGTNSDDAQSADLLVAIIENRAKEIGIAVFDAVQLSLRLLQFIGEPLFFIRNLATTKFVFVD
jgi:hypothetical protein